MYSGGNNYCGHCGCHDSQHHNCIHKVGRMKNNCFTRPIRAVEVGCIPHVPDSKPVQNGSRIAFSSGPDYPTLTTNNAGLPSQVSQVGFGTFIENTAGNPLVLSGANEAFTVSQDGFITSIAATFVLEAGADFQTSQGTISATIYKAAKGSNDFFPTAATVELSPFTGLQPAGAIASGVAQVNVPVIAEERLVMVFSFTETNLAPGFGGGTISGFASAGITIT